MSNSEFILSKPRYKRSKIWRYMDFTKYISLLDRQSLYFTRVDKLDDPFEGATSKENIIQRPLMFKDFGDANRLSQSISSYNEQIRKFYAVNCWHENEFESAAMWKLYLKSHEGIAIQSTIGRLLRCFNNDSEDKVYISYVYYIDYDKEWLPEGNIFYPFVHKRNSFEYENEIRALIVDFAEKDDQEEVEAKEIDLDKEVWAHGKYLPIEINTLIQNVYVSPTSPEWLFDLVKSITFKYNKNINVKKSSLSESPLY